MRNHAGLSVSGYRSQQRESARMPIILAAYAWHFKVTVMNLGLAWKSGKEMCRTALWLLVEEYGLGCEWAGLVEVSHGNRGEAVVAHDND
jgi:hypothetical protein